MEERRVQAPRYAQKESTYYDRKNQSGMKTRAQGREGTEHKELGWVQRPSMGKPIHKHISDV